MLYSLSNHLEKLCYTKIEGYEAGNVTLNSVKYSGEYLRKILKHILVCRVCNRHLMYFLRLLEECVPITVPFQQRCIDNMQQDYVDPETDVPICQYILDANFDNLRRTALLDSFNFRNVCHCPK
jgi:hypothetical protein